MGIMRMGQMRNLTTTDIVSRLEEWATPYDSTEGISKEDFLAIAKEINDDHARIVRDLRAELGAER